MMMMFSRVTDVVAAVRRQLLLARLSVRPCRCQQYDTQQTQVLHIHVWLNILSPRHRIAYCFAGPDLSVSSPWAGSLLEGPLPTLECYNLHALTIVIITKYVYIYFYTL